jgi:S-adenosylmethionine decarboxylase
LTFDGNFKSPVRLTETTGLALGRQLTIEYYDCSTLILLDKEQIGQAMLKAAKDSGATVVSSSFHTFSPQGVSGVVVIAESHFTIHTWPEHDYAAVDMFTCGKGIDFETAINVLKESFESSHVVISSDQNRGLLHRQTRQQEIGRVLRQSGVRPVAWNEAFEQQQPWGMLTSVDIYRCDPKRIRDADRIRQFTVQLCDMIEMQRDGECRVVHFGEDEKTAGFSMTQLIKTSLISGHFANASNAAYLDIFSCKYYEPRQVAEFALEFFKGGHYKMQVAFRQ